MASVNKVILIGNLTRDPELRYTPKGTAVADLGLAVNRKYKVENDLREETTFVDITFWGVQAETISKYMEKGRPIYIEGRLQLDSWEDKTTGQKRSRLRVVGDNFQFLGTGGGGSGGSSYSDSEPPQRQSQPATERTASPPVANDMPDFDQDDDDDEIPF